MYAISDKGEVSSSPPLFLLPNKMLISKPSLSIHKLFIVKRSAREPHPLQLPLLYGSSHDDKMPCKILNKRNTRCSLQKVTRRLANYHPSIWNHELIQSMRSPFIEERFTEYLDELKFEAKSLLKACDGLSAQLQHINLMQRLGVACHFEQEINDVFGNAYANGFEHFDDLGDSALCFRLLRQHGYYVSTDIFDRFRDENGFRSCYADDIRGLLSLYEASYIEVDEGEVLKEAREFSFRHLNQLPLDADFSLVEQVRHAMEVPLHWRRPRLEHKYFIHSYQREEGCNPLLVELAKLDYNIIQSLHLEEMKTLSWWWEELGKKLKYSRDRLLENYLWTVGIASEPQFSKCRIILTKIISILSVVDDIYDTYATLDEAQLFTQSLKSLHPEAKDGLPDYMKWYFLAVNELINEASIEIEMDHGWDAKSLIKKEWERLCEAFLVEAEWYNKGYKPSLQEYLNNAWITVGGPIVMAHAYFLLGNKPVGDDRNSLQDESGIIYWSSLLVRLANDLATSKAEKRRGDVSKSVDCHQNETGGTEEASMEFIKGLMSYSWTQLNKEKLLSGHLPQSFTSMAVNMARAAHCIYQHGDGVGTSTGITKNKITSMFFEYIPME